MRKKGIIFILVIIFFNCAGFFNAKAQAGRFEFYVTRNIHNQLRLNTNTGEVMQIQDDGLSWVIQTAIETNGTVPRFKLIETRNMWNFILLDEFSGRLWQVQFSVDEVECMLSIPINLFRLSYTEVKKFTVHPLTSMYQFYLINEESGEMWKFQWTTQGDEYRWIEKIVE